ncbi:MAG: hypothetical protein WD036_10025 [Bauldia sp.]
MSTRHLIAVVAAIFTSCLVSAAQAEPGTCRVTAGSSGNFRYAAIKCALKRDPANYVIRSTAWESEDPKGYKELAPVAGRSFACELTQGRSEARGDIVTNYYELSDCR